MWKLLFFLIFVLFITEIEAQNYSVKSFGAVGDGTTDDTKSIRAALSAAASSNGGRVIFDAGYTFLTGCFNVSSNVILDVRGTILASINVSDYEIIPINSWYGNYLVKQPLVFSYNASNITITGGGTIDGNGPYWYACMYNSTLAPCYPYDRPRLVQPTLTSNLLIENITLKDSPYWTLHLAWTTNVYINNVNILSPIGILISQGWGLNTDGIDVECSVNVTIENCNINTADDAIAIKSGLNWYGRTYGRPTENVMVRNLNIGYSNGLAVGSEMSAGVRNVTFKDSTLNGSLHAVLVKTELGRGGTIQDITYSNITVYNTNYTIELNMYYSTPANDSSIPTIKNIVINNVVSNNTNFAYNILGMPNSTIQNVYFSNINITNVTKQITHNCMNINGICNNSTVLPYCPPCLVQEGCFDASSGCAQNVNLCGVQTYHATMCNQCRKTCSLCQSC